ncbi:PH domain-containing protein [Haloechinothrix sp. YIM 98757]|uniref:PH domain-containing protein n=1 Tax=Haloechinothrix aidingensis TaxID=2752311 RepID=A0A838AAD5_9PSEU|nr:PH domain-containing protein [Haloechinothrix aidingensis]MBA0126187.1 PH domain-containing protein [Haloechinothrix aidingensis]
MTESVRLRPPTNRLNPRCLAWWRVRFALVVLPLTLVVAVLGVLLVPALLILAAAIGVVGSAVSVLLPAWWYRVHRWEVTDRAVYTRTGYFWQEWRVAPMSRIQTVDTARGPLQQLFRLATVTVTTASAKGAVEIAGLDAQLASSLAEELTETTQATPGDAT